MARIYAGILGPLALSTFLIRGMIHGSSPDGVLWGACVSLVAFAAVGGVVGGIADWIVEGSVRAQIEADVAARQAGEADKPRGNSESQVQ